MSVSSLKFNPLSSNLQSTKQINWWIPTGSLLISFKWSKWCRFTRCVMFTFTSRVRSTRDVTERKIPKLLRNSKWCCRRFSWILFRHCTTETDKSNGTICLEWFFDVWSDYRRLRPARRCDRPTRCKISNVCSNAKSKRKTTVLPRFAWQNCWTSKAYLEIWRKSNCIRWTQTNVGTNRRTTNAFGCCRQCDTVGYETARIRRKRFFVMNFKTTSCLICSRSSRVNNIPI